MTSIWLHILAVISLATGIICAAAIAGDIAENPQPMGIMNLVWPISALYGGVLALVVYLLAGARAKQQKPLPISVAVGATHCGAGCTLGDILAEWLAFAAPAIAVWFGWQSIFGEKMFAVWVVDFIFAFGFGIVFQYFAIAPMRGLSFWPGIVVALKADTLSLTAWQVGMYGFMALAQYAYFRPLLGKPVQVNTPEFWFVMQIAMLCGFVTSYPVNWWLIAAGVKEKM